MLWQEVFFDGHIEGGERVENLRTAKAWVIEKGVAM